MGPQTGLNKQIGLCETNVKEICKQSVFRKKKINKYCERMRLNKITEIFK